MKKAVVLAALLLAGLAFGEAALPARVTIGNSTYDGELEISNGLPVVIVGESRYLLRLGASDLDAAGLKTLTDLAKEGPDDRLRSVPFELGDAHKNASLQKVHVTLRKSTVEGMQADRIQLEFRYAHSGPLDPETRFVKTLVGLDKVAPAFPYTDKESYGVSFDQNVMPVRLLEIISQPATDRHGNKVTLRRARVVSLAELRQAEKRTTLSVYDVPATALLFMTPEESALHVERITRKGLGEEEFHQAERYLLGDVAFDKAKSVEPQLLAFTAEHRLDVAFIQKDLIRKEFERRAVAATGRDRHLEMAEDLKRVNLLLEDFMEVDHAQKLARLEEIHSMVPLLSDGYESLINLMAKYQLADNGAQVREVQRKVTEILKEGAPLPEAAALHVMKVVNRVEPGHGILVEMFHEVLVAANRDNALENLALKTLLNEGTNVEDRPAARRALAVLGASGTAKAMLLVAMGSKSGVVRDSAMHTLRDLGPYETLFLLEVVKMLKGDIAREEAARLLVYLDPPQMEIVTALTDLIRQEGPEVQLAAASVLKELRSNFGNLDEDVIAAINRCKRNP